MKSFVTMINNLTKKIEDCTKKVNQKSEQIDTKYNLEIILLKMLKNKFYKHPDTYEEYIDSLDAVDKKYHPHDRILPNIPSFEPRSSSIKEYHRIIMFSSAYIRNYMKRYHITLESLNIICNYSIKLLCMADIVMNVHDSFHMWGMDNEYEIMLKHLNKKIDNL